MSGILVSEFVDIQVLELCCVFRVGYLGGTVGGGGLWQGWLAGEGMGMWVSSPPSIETAFRHCLAEEGGRRGLPVCRLRFVRGGPFGYLVGLSEGVIFGDFLGREKRGIYLVSLGTKLCHGDIEGLENGWVEGDLSVVFHDFEGESALYVFLCLISF